MKGFFKKVDEEAIFFTLLIVGSIIFLFLIIAVFELSVLKALLLIAFFMFYFVAGLYLGLKTPDEFIEAEK